MAPEKFKNTISDDLSAIPFDFPGVIACYLNIGYGKISIVDCITSLLHLEIDFKLDCTLIIIINLGYNCVLYGQSEVDKF